MIHNRILVKLYYANKFRTTDLYILYNVLKLHTFCKYFFMSDFGLIETLNLEQIKNTVITDAPDVYVAAILISK